MYIIEQSLSDAIRFGNVSGAVWQCFDKDVYHTIIHGDATTFSFHSACRCSRLRVKFECDSMRLHFRRVVSDNDYHTEKIAWTTTEELHNGMNADVSRDLCDRRIGGNVKSTKHRHGMLCLVRVVIHRIKYYINWREKSTFDVLQTFRWKAELRLRTFKTHLRYFRSIHM